MKKTKTAAEAMRQIRRLKSKPFYPSPERGDDGQLVNFGEQELARALHAYAESDEHMRRVIDAAVIQRFGDSGSDRCPSPSDLWGVCREINPTPVASARNFNPNCEYCEGTGFMITIRADGISGASRCPNQCAIPGGDALTGGHWNYTAEQRRCELKRATSSIVTNGAFAMAS